MIDDAMLTTFDNPFNPFKEYDQWFKWDFLGFNCQGTLANEAIYSDVASDSVNELETLLAMKRIVKKYPKIYRIVDENGNTVDPDSITDPYDQEINAPVEGS
jgi:hypothetical protein